MKSSIPFVCCIVALLATALLAPPRPTGATLVPDAVFLYLDGTASAQTSGAVDAFTPAVPRAE